jgi:hypothetical protein
MFETYRCAMFDDSGGAGSRADARLGALNAEMVRRFGDARRRRRRSLGIVGEAERSQSFARQLSTTFSSAKQCEIVMARATATTPINYFNSSALLHSAFAPPDYFLFLIVCFVLQ